MNSKSVRFWSIAAVVTVLIVVACLVLLKLAGTEPDQNKTDATEPDVTIYTSENGSGETTAPKETEPYPDKNAAEAISAYTRDASRRIRDVIDDVVSKAASVPKAYGRLEAFMAIMKNAETISGIEKAIREYEEAQRAEKEREELLEATVRELFGDRFATIDSKIEDTYLNVRSTPGGDVIGMLYPGTGGYITGIEKGWALISSGNVTGWVSTDYIALGQDIANAGPKVYMMIMAQYLRLRSEPDENSSPIDVLTLGTMVDYVSCLPGWVCVSYQGHTGYLHSDYVDVRIGDGVAITMEEFMMIEEMKNRETEPETQSQPQTEPTPEQTQPTPVVPASISASVSGGDRVVGSSLSVYDFTVNITMSDGTVLTNPPGWGASPMLLENEGDNVVTVSYGGLATQIVVRAYVPEQPTVEPQPVVPAAVSASVAAGTRYVGDSLNAFDFTVTITMSDGSSVINPPGWGASPMTLSYEGENHITVVYGGLSTDVVVVAYARPTQPPSSEEPTPEQPETPEPETPVPDTPSAEDPTPEQPETPESDSPSTGNADWDYINAIYAQGNSSRQPVYLDHDSIVLMACDVTLEVGNAGHDMQLAVANVILNRLLWGYWGNTVNAVLRAPGQFYGSEAGGLLDTYIAKGPKQECLQAVYEALAGINNVRDCIFFKRATQSSYSYDYYFIIGNGVFYPSKYYKS